MSMLPNGVDMSKRQTYGQGNALTSEQVAQILFQAGFRGDALIYFTGVAMRESRNQPGIRGTEADPSALTGDFGLFGINASNDSPEARAAVGYTSRAQWTDPLINAKMAFYLSQGGKNLAPWGGSSQGWAAGGDPYYGVNMKAASAAVTNAQNQGLLGVNWQGQGGGMADPVYNQGAVTPTSTFKLPSDAKVVRLNETGEIWALFDLGGTQIAYQIIDPRTPGATSPVDYSATPPQPMSQQDFIGIGAVNGGDASELGSVSTSFGTYKGFWDSIVGQVMGYNNPAKDDPEVRKVLAEFAARPDMSSAELQNRLEATSWWKQHTSGQLEWNGLSDGEKQKRRDDTAARMADTWAQYTGQFVDATDPRIQNYLEDVASGKMGFGSFTEQVVKKAALAIANSPYQRQQADEKKAEKQPGVDIENTAMRIRQTLNQWGLQWSQGTITDWATKIVNNDSSDDDLMESVKTQAQVLYPWKDREMATKDAASPWLETYGRVMEKQADLFEPKVQAALTKGQPAWEFEQELKRSNEWLGTKNARESLTSMAGSVGRLMGFS